MPETLPHVGLKNGGPTTGGTRTKLGSIPCSLEFADFAEQAESRAGCAFREKSAQMKALQMRFFPVYFPVNREMLAEQGRV